MEFKLINTNFENNYIKQYVSGLGANADTLLNPTKEELQTPYDLDNIEAGANLLLSVIKKNGNILFIVDPDVDGFTSSAILWNYIKSMNPLANLVYKVHSGKQHGLEDMIDEIEDEAGQGYLDLIILPDSSSNDEEYHYRLRSINIPVLVIDHHEANEYSSDAVVINNQLSTKYKNKQLTGAGMIYQFCRVLDDLTGNKMAENFIDLAALGIISDMGKIIEPENAYIIKNGLAKPNKNYLFNSFIEKQSYSIGGNLNYIAVAFYITPLINALIRVGSMTEKENLFLAFIDGHKIVPSTKRGEKGQNEDLATQVVRNCVNARAHQNKELDGAIERIDFKIADQELTNNKLLIVELDEDDSLTSTLNGLLAMKLSSKYKRPTLVVRTNSEGIARGSLRGLNNSEFKDLRGYLEGTGICEYAQGHAQAAGLGIKQSLIPKLLEVSNKDLANYNFGQTYYEVNFQRRAFDNDIASIIRDIDKYKAIFGQGCPEPIIAVTNLDITKSSIQIMGKNKDTVKIMNNGIAYMIFHASDFIEQLSNIGSNSLRLEVVGRANMNEWMGTYTPQIFIDDYNIYDNTLLF